MPGKPTILESFTDSTFCSISTAARSASDAAGYSGSCVTSIISELMAYLSHAQRPRTVIVCSCLQLLSMTQLRALNINAPLDADIDFETSARSLFQLMLELYVLLCLGLYDGSSVNELRRKISREVGVQKHSYFWFKK